MARIARRRWAASLSLRCATVAVAAAAGGGGPAGASAPKYLSYFGTNVSAQHEWLNLAIAAYDQSNPYPSHDAVDDRVADEFFAHGIPSLIPMPQQGVYSRPRWDKTGRVIQGGGLVPGWEATLERFAASRVLPRMKNGTAAGVFVGDEICCHNTSCWHGQLYPISAKLRALLGPRTLLYENECIDSYMGGVRAGPPLDKTAPDLNLVSVDLYRGYTPTDCNGTVEAVKARKFAETEIYPRLHDHQRIMAVPGTFACSNGSFMPLELSIHSVAEKVRAYFEWIKEDSRVAGLCPWHFNDRHKLQAHGACDLEIGAISMPPVLRELREIGAWIKAHGVGG